MSLVDDPVRVYLRRAGRIALLDAAQEVELAMRIEVGLFAEERLAQCAADSPPSRRQERELRQLVAEGRAAKEQFICANLRLVVSIAKRHRGRGLDFLDLIQEGNIGLIRAVERFDYTAGWKFSTFATWSIRQAMSRAIDDASRLVRVPSPAADQIRRMKAVVGMLASLAGEPSLAELAEELGLPVARVAQLQRWSLEPLSLEALVWRKHENTIRQVPLGSTLEQTDGLAPDDAAAVTLLREHLMLVLHTLSSREAQVLRLRFGLDGGRTKSLHEIAQAFGVTKDRIRQIESRTLEKLRAPELSDQLRDYLRPGAGIGSRLHQSA